MTLPTHGYDRGLDFGGVLVDLIDNVALPQLTGVSSLGALANQLVNCGGVADWVWSYIGNICIGSQCLYQYISSNDIAKLCTNALNAAGDAVESKLASLTAPGKIGAGDGSCLAVENMGHTGHADSLTNGAWSLTLPVGVEHDDAAGHVHRRRPLAGYSFGQLLRLRHVGDAHGDVARRHELTRQPQLGDEVGVAEVLLLVAVDGRDVGFAGEHLHAAEPAGRLAGARRRDGHVVAARAVEDASRRRCIRW